jgi:hypothetical protein
MLHWNACAVYAASAGASLAHPAQPAIAAMTAVRAGSQQMLVVEWLLCGCRICWCQLGDFCPTCGCITCSSGSSKSKIAADAGDGAAALWMPHLLVPAW